MKVATIFTLVGVASLNAQVATATCNSFWGNTEWHNRENARGYVRDACYNNGGMFTGVYSPRQTKRMCPSGHLFEIENLNGRDSFDLGNDDCYNRLISEINNCDYGGESTQSGWRFK